ncbi:ABC transporter substrate-binding protein [Paenibacillus aquistagni]|uniref:ABC transporter substrate-binding protein n=1 Tax=Paenibacillus aquistagni TaxID=1852522 RepID=UPI00145B0B41|nr:ABC transporter substrate-binding protein [Paenibacillus aquistagni]NMM54906.1 ABC transporter substrate-binding protein [Paenibacillus aquistagni]
MKKFGMLLSLVMALSIVLTACGGNAANESKASENTASETVNQAESKNTASQDAAQDKRVVKYLDQEYELPANTEQIVITGAIEALEDAVLLDVHPIGASSVGGKFPEIFASITDKAESVGEKTEPNFEKILALKPDVILASSKSEPAVIEQLNKIAPAIPYSHVSTNWEENVTLLGELSGKQDQAAKVIADYKADLESAKSNLSDKLKDKEVAMIRVRSGELMVYSPTVFFNPFLYEDLGLAVPAEVQAAKKQEKISVEKLAEMNPDYLLVQFSPDENKDNPNALEDFKNNPIVSKLDAVKNGHLYVNLVDPLAQGGTAYSKVAYLKAFVSELSK